MRGRVEWEERQGEVGGEKVGGREVKWEGGGGRDGMGGGEVGGGNTLQLVCTCLFDLWKISCTSILIGPQ